MGPMFFTSTHILVDSEDDFNIEVEDIGKLEIRLTITAGKGPDEVSDKHHVTLTLAEMHALKLCHLIETYFQDKNTKEV